MKWVKTFESFLFENTSVKSSPIVKELNRILDLNKKRGADEIDVYTIPNNWTVYDKVAKPVKKDMMEPSQCFQNALDFSKKNSNKCVVGGFIDKNALLNQAKWVDSNEENLFRAGLVFYPHAFNLNDKDEVYDVTIYNDPNRWVYVGIEIDPNKFDKGFTDLLPYLNKLIGRKI